MPFSLLVFVVSAQKSYAGHGRERPCVFTMLFTVTQILTSPH